MISPASNDAMISPASNDAMPHSPAPADEDKLFTYVIVRDDLEMPAGKLAAQASHAAAQSLIHYLTRNPHDLATFAALGKSGSRIVLKAKNLSQLQAAQAAAEEAGLPNAVFEDEGHILLPHFDGSPVITALAIGPCPREEARPFTKKFRCV